MSLFYLAFSVHQSRVQNPTWLSHGCFVLPARIFCPCLKFIGPTSHNPWKKRDPPSKKEKKRKEKRANNNNNKKHSRITTGHCLDFSHFSTSWTFHTSHFLLIQKELKKSRELVFSSLWISLSLSFFFSSNIYPSSLIKSSLVFVYFEDPS